MLKTLEAVTKINEAVYSGAQIFCPRDGALKEIPCYQVARVADDLTVFFSDADGQSGCMIEIRNDYRLESMYAQAQHFLLNRAVAS